jgi:Malic enzyme, NAD binding domain
VSNPTDKVERTPTQAYESTDGNALVAAAVQFPDVTVGGKTFRPGQANNFYIFSANRARGVCDQAEAIDRVFIAAARRGQPGRPRQGYAVLAPGRYSRTEMTTETWVAEYVFERGQTTGQRRLPACATISRTFLHDVGTQCSARSAGGSRETLHDEWSIHEKPKANHRVKHSAARR